MIAALGPLFYRVHHAHSRLSVSSRGLIFTVAYFTLIETNKFQYNNQNFERCFQIQTQLPYPVFKKIFALIRGGNGIWRISFKTSIKGTIYARPFLITYAGPFLSLRRFRVI